MQLGMVQVKLMVQIRLPSNGHFDIHRWRAHALLKHDVARMPSADRCRHDKVKEHAEFIIDETFGVPGVGTVIAGTVKRGVITTNANLMLGPDVGDGTFKLTAIKSIQYKRLPVTRVCSRSHCPQGRSLVKCHPPQAQVFKMCFWLHIHCCLGGPLHFQPCHSVICYYELIPVEVAVSRSGLFLCAFASAI